MAGKIYFIGAGPGDPDLLTVKGSVLLGRADVVIYAGSLVMKKVIERYCRVDAVVRDSSSMTLEEITGLMAESFRDGKTVARLHTGDPSIYSALAEQAGALEREGIPYEVVPGVSSAFAAAAALGKELTLPEVTQTVILTRLEGMTPVPGKESLSSLASHRAAMCIFLSVSMIDDVVKELLSGYPPDTPVAVVSKATWEDELIIRGTLSDIGGRVKASGVTRQAVILVGESVGDGPPGKTSRLYDRGFSHGYRP